MTHLHIVLSDIQLSPISKVVPKIILNIGEKNGTGIRLLHFYLDVKIFAVKLVYGNVLSNGKLHVKEGNKKYMTYITFNTSFSHIPLHKSSLEAIGESKYDWI